MKLGFNILNPSYFEAALDLMLARKGIRPIRVGFSMYGEDQGPNWSLYDRMHRAMVARSIPHLILLGYVPDAWVDAGGWWGRWMDEYFKPCVTKYFGPLCLGFQIWNEPLTLEWSSRYTASQIFSKTSDYIDFLWPCRLTTSPEIPLVAAAPMNILQSGDGFKQAVEMARRLPDGVEMALHIYGPNFTKLAWQSLWLPKGAWVTEFGDGQRWRQPDTLTWTGWVIDKILKPKHVFWYHWLGHDNHAALRYGDSFGPLEESPAIWRL